ncbi:hypothetical protein C8E97_1238 [Saccharothrix australiensis]|uniref:Uncharacterized protein n=1 Tax=Saccharothrix australiensis TaxID=2072 RepID=A0A495VWH7_9PSEU|nr:hypothetical protein C8E97_1238 [Saccharothrix australiensis]
MRRLGPRWWVRRLGAEVAGAPAGLGFGDAGSGGVPGAAHRSGPRYGSIRSRAAPSHVVCVQATPRPFFGRSTS